MARSTGVAPDGTVFPVGGGVFAFRLVGHDAVVGDGIGAGAGDFAVEEAEPAALCLEDGFLLVVDVENVEGAGDARR